MKLNEVFEREAYIEFIDHCTGFVKVRVVDSNAVRWLSGANRPDNPEVGQEGVLRGSKHYYGTCYEFLAKPSK